LARPCCRREGGPLKLTTACVGIVRIRQSPRYFVAGAPRQFSLRQFATLRAHGPPPYAAQVPAGQYPDFVRGGSAAWPRVDDNTNIATSATAANVFCMVASGVSNQCDAIPPKRPLRAESSSSHHLISWSLTRPPTRAASASGRKFTSRTWQSRWPTDQCR
jgi:hypothetical protein